LNGCPVVDRAATQRRDAAYRELHEKGYGDTTIAGVAEAVGVSVQTIYKSFGSKATLAKRVYDVTLVGDEDSIPLAERPAIQAIIAEPEPRRKLAMYAALGRKLIERVGPLAHVLLSRAKSADPELRAFAATTAKERLVGVTEIVGHLQAIGALCPGLSFERARDILWTLIAWEVYELLVIERGWSLDDWESWIAESAAVLLLR
jgi:AcrR family transcriptional regulator